MFFESYTEKLWGRHPREISAAWGAQRVKGLSIRAILADMLRKLHGKGDKSKVETSLIEEFSYPKYGPGQLWETVAERARQRGADIRLGCRVTGLTVEGGRVTGVRYEQDGQEHVQAADMVISFHAGQGSGAGHSRRAGGHAAHRRGPALPRFCHRWPAGAAPGTQERDGDEDAGQHRAGLLDLRAGRARRAWGASRFSTTGRPTWSRTPEHTVWIGLEYFCAEGDKYWNMSEAEWIDMAKRELVSMGVLSGTDAVLDAHQERVKKAYPAYFDTYDEMDKLAPCWTALQTSTAWVATASTATTTWIIPWSRPLRPCATSASGIEDKSNLWNVNTEQSYHETKEAK